LPSLTWSQSTMAARIAASGRRAHQMWSVEIWPWRMDFSRADWAEMGLRGREISMRRRLRSLSIGVVSVPLLVIICGLDSVKW
jgi:hypothetical protein